MVLPNDLPTDSVLRRHAATEQNRILGLPPSDSVLRRHYEQLGTMRPVGATAAPAPAPRAPARAQVATPASAPSPAKGGIWGWIQRLLGA
jgi:hypothetical protein